MQKSFSSVNFLNDLAQDLIDWFKKAGRATTPVWVGSTRENEVIQRLAQIFPDTIWIESWFVIDTHGHTSKQTDIIMFERNITTGFPVNKNAWIVYYPCESVIAVGEVKSTLNSEDLIDSFAKIKSVKESSRFFHDKTKCRWYCSRLRIQGSDSEYYSQETKIHDQIYSFILCEKIGLSMETFFDKCKSLIRQDSAHLLPNIIVSLHDGVFVYLDSWNNKFSDSKLNADSFYQTNNPSWNFQFLLSRINYFINSGRTTDTLPFDKYIINDTSLSGEWLIIKL